MELSDFICYPKEEIIKILEDKKIPFEIVEFNNLKTYDTLLLVKFEVVNGIYILYFDRFLLIYWIASFGVISSFFTGYKLCKATLLPETCLISSTNSIILL